MNTHIAPCDDTHHQTIFEIINESAIAYKGHIPADCWHVPYMSKEELAGELLRGVRFSGFFHEGHLVGVMGSEDVKDVTLIRHAYVRHKYQGQGIGTALLHEWCGRATRPVMIGTWKDAVWAIRFYERNGFALANPAQTRALLNHYWTVSERQKDVAVVLLDECARQLVQARAET